SRSPRSGPACPTTPGTVAESAATARSSRPRPSASTSSTTSCTTSTTYAAELAPNASPHRTCPPAALVHDEGVHFDVRRGRGGVLGAQGGDGDGVRACAQAGVALDRLGVC